MKKNVFLIVLDSFIYDKIGVQKYGPTTTPFLDCIKQESLNCENLYSNGPFTEAGATSLLSGNDLLNEGGYMHNINTKNNHFIDVFSENGYEIFDVFHPYFMYSENILKKIDHQYFSSDFIFNSVYSNRIKHFITIKESRNLNQNEYNDIIVQLELTFSSWFNFISYNEKNRSKYILIKNAIRDYDFQKSKSLLNSEYKLFTLDKVKYANGVLNLKGNHPLFTIENIKPSNLINIPIINKYYFKKNFFFLIKIIYFQFWWNIKNNRISFKKLLSSFFQNLKEKKFSGYFKSVTFTLTSGLFCLKYKRGNFLKEMPSFNAHIELTLRELQKRDLSKPFFVKIHPEDLHNRTSIISYDAVNKETIIEETRVLRNYFSKIEKNFEGSLIYDMSVVYVDLCIKRLFEGLKKLSLLNDTIIVITSDHGCSYVNSPIRDRFVNNFHTENYHIPLIIYDKSLQACTIRGYYNSKDVLPTIYDLCNINCPNNITGRSMLKDKDNSLYAISEYMGSGCPDLRIKPINYIIRDRFYLVAYVVMLDQHFNDGKVLEIYDLLHDYKEEVNLIKLPDFKIEKIEYLLDFLSKRHSQLKHHYTIL